MRGAEGKIKAGLTPCEVTPCLHIDFGSDPRASGVTPDLALRAIKTEVLGSDPFTENTVFIGNLVP